MANDLHASAPNNVAPTTRFHRSCAFNLKQRADSSRFRRCSLRPPGDFHIRVWRRALWEGKGLRLGYGGDRDDGACGCGVDSWLGSCGDSLQAMHGIGPSSDKQVLGSRLRPR